MPTLDELRRDLMRTIKPVSYDDIQKIKLPNGKKGVMIGKKIYAKVLQNGNKAWIEVN